MNGHSNGVLDGRMLCCLVHTVRLSLWDSTARVFIVLTYPYLDCLPPQLYYIVFAFYGLSS